mmetsp:Transcript_53570/g.109658  ORF Transcript_53570/g.109658 Transcript_53570/m.109658 type:complete len:253 (+) Transcript_53570:604-1362(+)
MWGRSGFDRSCRVRSQRCGLGRVTDGAQAMPDRLERNTKISTEGRSSTTDEAREKTKAAEIARTRCRCRRDRQRITPTPFIFEKFGGRGIIRTESGHSDNPEPGFVHGRPAPGSVFEFDDSANADRYRDDVRGRPGHRAGTTSDGSVPERGLGRYWRRRHGGTRGWPESVRFRDGSNGERTRSFVCKNLDNVESQEQGAVLERKGRPGFASQRPPGRRRISAKRIIAKKFEKELIDYNILSKCHRKRFCLLN